MKLYSRPLDSSERPFSRMLICFECYGATVKRVSKIWRIFSWGCHSTLQLLLRVPGLSLLALHALWCCSPRTFTSSGSCAVTLTFICTLRLCYCFVYYNLFPCHLQNCENLCKLYSIRTHCIMRMSCCVSVFLSTECNSPVSHFYEIPQNVDWWETLFKGISRQVT